MPRTYSYNLKQVAVIIDGLEAGGYQDGDAVNIEFNADAWTKTVGGDGEVSRAASNDTSGRITLTLMQTSRFNAELGAILSEDQKTSQRTFSVRIKDLLGQEEFYAGDCWIVRQPNRSFAKETGTREWLIDFGHGRVSGGGSNPMPIGV